MGNPPGVVNPTVEVHSSCGLFGESFDCAKVKTTIVSLTVSPARVSHIYRLHISYWHIGPLTRT